MIAIRPFEDYAALAVLNRLDPHDHMEAEAVRGAACTGLALFADWRMAQAHAALSVIAVSGPAERPFAVLTLGNTGQAGVAEAALLACDHRRHRTDLARLAVLIRAKMPGWALETGVRRIEARCWAGHPTAAALLAAIGFTHDCDMPGFGGSGQIVFRQFAWTSPPAMSAHPSTQPMEVTDVLA